ncbi:MAG: Fic family protein [Gammaproteobacteria bacterium]
MPHWIWEHDDWPTLKHDAAALADALARARRAEGRVLGAAQALDAPLSTEACARILTEDSLRTSAIEGEHLPLDAVRSSVARHLGLPTAGLPAPARHVDGLVEVLLDATRAHDQALTVKRLCRWQAALFPTGQSGLTPIRVGRLRGDAPMQVVSGPIGRQRVHFEAPPVAVLPKQLEVFVTWFNAPPAGLDGLLRAGLAHLWFVTLHPFEDGNGRLARALTDMAIAQDEREPMRWFSLSSQFEHARADYYELLERTQRGGLDVTPWLAWFLEQVTHAAESAHEVLQQTVAKARFWVAVKDLDLNARQRKVLNRLLDGFDGDLNNRKYMALAKTSRATATRELTALVELGLLEPVGAGRSRHYRLLMTTLRVHEPYHSLRSRV